MPATATRSGSPFTKERRTTAAGPAARSRSGGPPLLSRLAVRQERAAQAEKLRALQLLNALAEGSEDKDEVVVADLDLDLIDDVRQTWQFYRDRRPEAYDELVKK